MSVVTQNAAFYVLNALAKDKDGAVAYKSYVLHLTDGETFVRAWDMIDAILSLHRTRGNVEPPSAQSRSLSECKPAFLLPAAAG